MNSPVDVTIQFAIPFDHNVFVDEDVLGLAIDVEVAGVTATLEFPREAARERALLSPISAVRDVAPHLPDELWGIKDDFPYIEVTSALVSVPGRTHLDFDIEKDQVSGYHDLVQQVSEWWNSFCHWLWSITTQSLNPVDPDPKVVHRRSMNVITMVKHAGRSSIPGSAFPNIVIMLSSGGVSAERIINAAVVRRACTKAGSTVPLYLELFASARMAARRGDRRRSIIDIGSVCESALSALLSLQPGHKLTLGGLVSKAQSQRHPLPADIKTAVVDLRNDAVHRGVVPINANVGRALEIGEELIVLIDSHHIPTTSLTSFNRPQRHDLLFLRCK